jgi:tRNA pseudouridine13 synthase
MLNADTYITPQTGIGGKIRVKYEDFHVEEIPETLPSGTGPNTWLFIEKVGRNTLDVVLDVAKELHLNRKRMGFAGMKDKTAITRQWICISNIEPDKLLNLEEKLYNVKILKITQNEKKLRIGQLMGNKFRILIRDTSDLENDTENAKEILTQLTEQGVLNYYGWQRFGKNRPNTHIVGKYLTKNDLKGAVDSYIGNPYPEEANHIKAARELYDNGYYEEAYDSMPAGMRYEKMMLRTLMKEKNNNEELTDESYKKILLSLPKPLSRMFIHAYQSFLFNKAVSERSKLGLNKYVEGDIIIDNEEHEVHPSAPLFGSKMPIAGGVVGEIEREILDHENLKLEDFKVTKMPKLGSHGLRRAIRFKVWDIEVKNTDDGIMVEFSIPKGCYATAVLREIMKVTVY